MAQELYYLPAGLEIVKLDDSRLTVAIFDRRFTLQDDSGILEELFRQARNGLDKENFVTEMSVPADVVDGIIEKLLQSKFLKKGTPVQQDSGLAAFGFVAAQIIRTGAEPPERESWHVVVIGDGKIADAVATAVLEHGIDISRSDVNEIHRSPADALLVCCADFEDHTMLRRCNQEALRHKLRCLYVSLDNFIVRCGPLVVPHATACYECYFHRVRSTRKFVPEFDARLSADNWIERVPVSHVALNWARAIVTTQVAAALTGTDLETHLSPMREIDSLSGEMMRSSVLKIPRCPACGRANATRPLSAILHPSHHALKAG
jgi:bacteriocin biosynthesis cyclodehydratase domain-containing protein